ncbi:NUDIX hydrolase [Tsukamurella serpentis]
MSAAEPVVRAAGGVLWRESADGPEVAVVHRPRYDDWSLPKGHVEPDEHPVVGGLREVVEETGFRARFVREIGDISYPVPRRRKHGPGGASVTKAVSYWSALALGGRFVPNEETDELRWLPVREASALLTYPMDEQVLGWFGSQPRSASTMVIVRHAKAGRKQGYQGDDQARPLDSNGRAQAEALVDLLGTFAPGELLSAPPVRCTQTLEPFSAESGLPITEEPTMSEAAYARDPEAAHRRIREIAVRGEESGTVPVVCSQGGVIPDLTAWWAKADDVTLPEARNRKASAWVLTTSGGRLLTMDHIDSPLPLKR